MTRSRMVATCRKMRAYANRAVTSVPGGDADIIRQAKPAELVEKDPEQKFSLQLTVGPTVPWAPWERSTVGVWV
jgi:hypothetical protein